MAASFQAAVVDVLVDRVAQAIGMAPQCRLLVVAGGVAANGPIRAALAQLAHANGLAMAAPPLRLCGDNAVMVGWAAIERLCIGVIDGLDAAPRPRWPLSELTGG
jgi:N6-L-threonylcarbamoyladenine synthase